MVYTYIEYICKHCLNEYSHIIRDNETEDEAYSCKYEKCPYCHSEDYVRISFISNDEGHKQYRKSLRLLKRNPEFDHKLYRKRIADEKKQRQQRIENTRTILVSSQPKPKCPTCGSTNVEKISTLNRAVSIGVAGLASDKIGKQFCCKNCGYKW